MKYYFLDPDNNKKDPNTLHCARCKKEIKSMSVCGIGFHEINYDDKYPMFRLSKPFEKADAVIGNDCLEYVKNNF